MVAALRDGNERPVEEPSAGHASQWRVMEAP